MSRKVEKDIQSVKADAKKQLGWVPGVLGFGVGRNTLRVYIDNSNVKDSLPEKFEGVELDFVVTGDINPA